ncbi:MAG: PocR ligand-binding domain-containing protein [Eubacteriales bacterium]
MKMNLNYNLMETQKLLFDFYNLTKCRIGIFDRNFHEVMAYPDRLSAFCKRIRNHDELNEICKGCDYKAFSRCKKEKQMITYQCHMGLTEMIAPIQANNQIIGYLMAGQILEEEQFAEKWEEVLQQLQQYPVDFLQLEVDYKNRSKLKQEKMQSVVNLVNIYASYIAQSELISVPEHSLSYKIDHYILNHLQEELDVYTLCQAFGFCKTTFYKVTNELFGVSIIKHVRQLRVQAAKNLLATTDASIAEIAEEVGIMDYNYFTKIFKQETKCTPREFRKNNILSV